MLERIKNEATYIIETSKTIREIAKQFNVSKSTVHKDLKYRLKSINLELFVEVEKMLKKHLAMRHIEGGEATRRKYLKTKRSLIWLTSSR